MNRIAQRARGALAWAWKHTAAGVAVVLIIAALAIGYQIGRPAPEPEPEVAQTEAGTSTGEPQMYTCPMHPSVKLPDADAKCPICHMDLIPLTAGGGGPESERRLVLTEAAAESSRIETAPVGRFFPTAKVRLYGKVTYDQTSVARLTAYFPGRIERLFVHYPGVPVQRGEHLAEVYSPDLLAAFEELRQAVQSAGAAEGGSDLVSRSSRGMLVAAREKLRLFGLTDEQIGAIERGEFDSDRLTIYAPTGGIVTHLAVREGDYVTTGQEIATVADLTRLWLDLEAYESQLPMLNWGQRVTFTVESHPDETFEGRVSFIEPVVDAGTRTAAVRVAVDNQDLRLKPGMFASSVVRVRVGEEGSVLSDELAGRWVCPMHPTEVHDEAGACEICGMDLLTAESLGVVGDPGAAVEPLVVPRSAVLFTGTRSLVYVSIPDAESPTYEGREVVLGPRAGDFYVVREGLREGERVVINGAFRVDSAMQIAAKPSMMTPGGDERDGARGGTRQTDLADAPDSFIFSLKPVYSAYFDAQVALAADDLDGFNLAVEDLRSAVGFVEEVGLVGEPLGAWRRAQAKLRVEPGSTDIDRARTVFGTVSEAIISLQRRFGHHGSETWHVAHCPMAFGNEGADWLQRGTEIVNPYMGTAMLRCGTVEGAFAPLSLDPSPNDQPEMIEGDDHE